MYSGSHSLFNFRENSLQLRKYEAILSSSRQNCTERKTCGFCAVDKGWILSLLMLDGWLHTTGGQRSVGIVGLSCADLRQMHHLLAPPWASALFQRQHGQRNDTLPGVPWLCLTQPLTAWDLTSYWVPWGTVSLGRTANHAPYRMGNPKRTMMLWSDCCRLVCVMRTVSHKRESWKRNLKDLCETREGAYRGHWECRLARRNQGAARNEGLNQD